ncbi:uncharacterized protein SCHCODRAFT_02524169 [Schizophyllum commune H4-8]|uniref:uncharacterized protein n=1 Tax=Schizophyllum commune (strain H4-8 / FGSC 9210) TaxID=578458 RepID=UPI00215F83F5|nr:uncharacterized protein SCHCODRAFT_02524169 [Schizophyllum commune H4-8]KAI5899518.1 hypothetical protein SCHCODRAFT_02524169 [Schizophyllum commune H4-8]
MSSHCLEIPEILIQICAKLSQPSLASFARTNSRICAVALDALWREQTSLLPLLKTLPKHKIIPVYGLLLTEDSIAQADWENTQTYAQRVKVLSFESHCYATDFGDGATDIIKTSIETYILHLHDAPIFPNLRKLDFGFVCWAYYEYLRFFIAPSLRIFCLRYRPGYQNAPDLAQILSPIPPLCPELAYLTLHEVESDFGDEAFLGVCLPYKDMVLGWSTLTRVDLAEAHPEAIRHLGRCGNLRHLRMCVDTDLQWPPAEVPGFKNGLSELVINARRGRWVAAIIECMSNATIAVTCVQVICSRERNRYRRRNLDVLAQTLDAASLREFTYASYRTFEGRDDPLPLSVLLQYARFRELTRFVVGCCGFPSFGDDALADLVSAWPHLQHLSIRGSLKAFDDRVDPHITLASLATLARYCPALGYFSCKPSSAKVPPLPDLVAAPRETAEPNSPSIELGFNVVGLPIENAEAVANYICAVFKDRQCTVTFKGRAQNGDDAVSMAKWEKVQSLVGAPED